MSISFRNNVPWKVFDFMKSNKFTDCTLVDDQQSKFEVHKIILSQRSKYFENIFLSSQNDSINEIKLSFNEQNVMSDLISYIYGQEIKINIDNLGIILKASKVYDVEDLTEAALSFFTKQLPSIPDKKILSLSEDFSKLGISELVTKIPEFNNKIASHLIESKHRTTIYQLISPIILCFALKSPVFNDINYKNIDKLKIIDDYIELKTENKSIDQILTEEDKKSLESLFSWEGDNAKRFLRYKCEWVSSRTSLNAVNEIINKRRNTLDKLEAEVKENESKLELTNKWIPFIFTSKVSNLSDFSFSGNFEIISCLNTLDGFMTDNYINPDKYGFVVSEASQPLGFYFSSDMALWKNDSRYFLSGTVSESSDQKPFYTINFGKACFNVNQIVINSDLKKSFALNMYNSNLKFELRRQIPDLVDIQGFASDNLVKPVYQNVKFNDQGKCTLSNIKFEQPVSKIKITMSSEEKNGGEFFRIKFIEVVGSFIH